MHRYRLCFVISLVMGFSVVCAVTLDIYLNTVHYAALLKASSFLHNRRAQVDKC